MRRPWRAPSLGFRGEPLAPLCQTSRRYGEPRIVQKLKKVGSGHRIEWQEIRAGGARVPCGCGLVGKPSKLTARLMPADLRYPF